MLVCDSSQGHTCCLLQSAADLTLGSLRQCPLQTGDLGLCSVHAIVFSPDTWQPRLLVLTSGQEKEQGARVGAVTVCVLGRGNIAYLRALAVSQLFSDQQGGNTKHGHGTALTVVILHSTQTSSWKCKFAYSECPARSWYK